MTYQVELPPYCFEYIAYYYGGVHGSVKEFQRLFPADKFTEQVHGSYHNRRVNLLLYKPMFVYRISLERKKTIHETVQFV